MSDHEGDIDGDLDGEDIFEVEKIIGMRIDPENPERKLYRVRWKGCSQNEDTWEPKENLYTCSDLLLEFKEKSKQKKKKDKKKKKKQSDNTKKGGGETSMKKKPPPLEVLKTEDSAIKLDDPSKQDEKKEEQQLVENLLSPISDADRNDLQDFYQTRTQRKELEKLLVGADAKNESEKPTPNQQQNKQQQNKQQSKNNKQKNNKSVKTSKSKSSETITSAKEKNVEDASKKVNNSKEINGDKIDEKNSSDINPQNENDYISLFTQLQGTSEDTLKDDKKENQQETQVNKNETDETEEKEESIIEAEKSASKSEISTVNSPPVIPRNKFNEFRQRFKGRPIMSVLNNVLSTVNLKNKINSPSEEVLNKQISENISTANISTSTVTNTSLGSPETSIVTESLAITQSTESASSHTVVKTKETNHPVSSANNKSSVYQNAPSSSNMSTEDTRSLVRQSSTELTETEQSQSTTNKNNDSPQSSASENEIQVQGNKALLGVLSNLNIFPTAKKSSNLSDKRNRLHDFNFMKKNSTDITEKESVNKSEKLIENTINTVSSEIISDKNSNTSISTDKNGVSMEDLIASSPEIEQDTADEDSQFSVHSPSEYVSKTTVDFASEPQSIKRTVSSENSKNHHENDSNLQKIPTKRKSQIPTQKLSRSAKLIDAMNQPIKPAKINDRSKKLTLQEYKSKKHRISKDTDDSITPFLSFTRVEKTGIGTTQITSASEDNVHVVSTARQQTTTNTHSHSFVRQKSREKQISNDQCGSNTDVLGNILAISETTNQQLRKSSVNSSKQRKQNSSSGKEQDSGSNSQSEDSDIVIAAVSDLDEESDYEDLFEVYSCDEEDFFFDSSSVPKETSHLSLPHANSKKTENRIVHQAILSGDKQKLIQYSLDQSQINEFVDEENTLLMIAVIECAPELVKMLLEKGADPNKPSKNGYTPLMMAVENKQLRLVGILIKFKAHLNFQTSSGETALIMACKLGHMEIIHVLLNSGADVKPARTYLEKFVDQLEPHLQHILPYTLHTHAAKLRDLTEHVFRNLMLSSLKMELGEPLMTCRCIAPNESNEHDFYFQCPVKALNFNLNVLLLALPVRFERTGHLDLGFEPSDNSITQVELNECEMLSLNPEGNFLFLLTPLQDELNTLKITTSKEETDCKILVCVYATHIKEFPSKINGQPLSQSHHGANKTVTGTATHSTLQKTAVR